MTKIYLFLLSLFCVATSRGQVTEVPYWSFNFSFSYDFDVRGSMHVNDPESPVDLISFSKDLDKTIWSSGEFTIQRMFQNFSSLNLSGEYFFISGGDNTARNIWFNGALIDSKEGITIDHSRLIRVQLNYEKLLNKPEASTRITLIGGLIYDFLLVEVTANILNEADTILLEEDFNDQVIPFPQIGARIEQIFGSHSQLLLQGTGTYIPRFSKTDIRKMESFSYYNLNSSLSYLYSINSIAFGPGISYRLLRTNEDEGAHDFYISLLSVDATLNYKF